MSRNRSLFFGIALIVFGGLALVGNLVLPLFGMQFRFWEVWRVWPMIVLVFGVLFVALPIMIRKSGMAVFFILGLPVLVTGAILMFTSVFGVWGAWEYLWPLEVLSVAAGFLFAAVYARKVWIAVPGIIIGMNGLVLAFTSVTGLWGWWAFLWAIEPLAIGLSFLLVSFRCRPSALFTLGLIFTGIAAAAFFGMVAILFSQMWVFRIAGPLILILLGVVALVFGMLPKRSLSKNLQSDIVS